MKYLGPIVLLLAVILMYAIMFKPEWVWTLGAVVVVAVLVVVVVTFVSDVRAQRDQK